MSDTNPRDDYQGHDRDLEEDLAAGDKPAVSKAEPEPELAKASTAAAKK